MFWEPILAVAAILGGYGEHKESAEIFHSVETTEIAEIVDENPAAP